MSDKTSLDCIIWVNIINICIIGAVAERSLPCIQSQWRQLGGATLHPRLGWGPGGDTPSLRSGAVAKKSYPTSEVSGGQEETPRVRDQGQPGEATSCLRPGVVTLRSHPEPKARGGSWEEPPTPEARAIGLEEQPEAWWLRRRRRA